MKIVAAFWKHNALGLFRSAFLERGQYGKGIVLAIVGCGAGGGYVDQHGFVQSWFCGIYEVKACEEND